MSKDYRDYEVIDYKSKEKSKLTAKQYIVYTYLLSISKHNRVDKEKHYYVYKDSFNQQEACEKLNISTRTWRNTIKKLIEYGYITDKKIGLEKLPYYIIKIPQYYIPLSIETLTTLLVFGTRINGGGIIVSLFCALYRYFQTAAKEHYSPDFSLSSLSKIFYKDSSRKENYIVIQQLIGVFSSLGLVKIEFVEKPYKGKQITKYRIVDMRRDVIDSGYGFEDTEEVERIMKAIS